MSQSWSAGLNFHYIQALAKHIHTMLINAYHHQGDLSVLAVYGSFYIWCLWRHSCAGAPVVVCLTATTNDCLPELKGEELRGM